MHASNYFMNQNFHIILSFQFRTAWTRLLCCRRDGQQQTGTHWTEKLSLSLTDNANDKVS